MSYTDENTNPRMTPEERQAFVRMIESAKERRRMDFEDRMSEKVRFDFLPKLMQQQGIVTGMQKAKQAIEELGEALRAIDSTEAVEKAKQGGSLWDRFTKPHDVREYLARMVRPYQQSEQEALKQYDHAALDVMSAQTPDDARKIVANLI